VDEESRKKAIAELLEWPADGEAVVLRATERFAVLCFYGATQAPEVFARMEDAGWSFVANVGSGCPMFRKVR
jgi:hypothetical protein